MSPIRGLFKHRRTMTLTVLLDLDDTLLGDVTDQFIPQYIHTLSNYFNFAPVNNVTKSLAEAIDAMTLNSSPGITLEGAFDRAFYPAIGVLKQDAASTVKRFYSEEYPKLIKYVTHQPQAVELVDELVSLGYDIVIATNPLFPKTATEQRLFWAGLPVEKYPFKIVSTYENFHFSKPNPAYYIELLAQLGWLEQPVVMIGNSLENDIKPCQKIGIPAFWIDDDNSAVNHSFQALDHGDITESLKWIKKQAEIPYHPWHNLTVDINTLLTTPAAIQTITKNISLSEWYKSIAPDEWPIAEIINHLLQSDLNVNFERIKQVVDEKNPFLNKMHSDETFSVSFNSPDPVFLMNAFLDVREKLISLIKNIKPDEWNRSARHSIFGPTNLQELVDFAATHDRVHIRQIFQTIAANNLTSGI